MNTKNLILILSFCVFSNVFAQKQERNNNVFIYAGMVNNGINLGTGYETKLDEKGLNSLAFDLNFQNLTATYNTSNLIYKEKSYLIGITYKRYFSINSNKLLPFWGLGVISGSEHVTAEPNGIYSVSPYTNFVFGGKTLLGLEYRRNKFSYFVEGSFTYSGYDFYKANMGIKYNFD